LTGEAAIDGTGNAKATVITGMGPTTSCPGFAGINTLIGDGNDTFGSARRWSAPAARAVSLPNGCFGQAHPRYLFGLDANVQSMRIGLLAPRVRQGVGGRWDGCR
jgi:hypothetical protein